MVKSWQLLIKETPMKTYEFDLFVFPEGIDYRWNISKVVRMHYGFVD